MSEKVTNERQVLVFTPTGKDGILICDLLVKREIPCRLCTSVEDLALGVREGSGVGLVAEEALVNVNIKSLVAEIEAQPAWSDFPLLLLTIAGTEPTEASTRILDILGRKANVTILERPIHVPTLLASIESALRARDRQYQVRDYLRDREQNEQKMLQMQKLESLGVLAGGVAHDFNNLLTGILGNASLALDNFSEELPVDELLQNIIDASQRAADLTRQLLAYSGKGQFLLQPINLSDLVQQITKLLNASIPKTVQVELELASELPSVLADSSQLQQIIMNLVINGAEAIDAERGGTVTVRTGSEMLDAAAALSAVGFEDLRPGLHVCLQVEDNGSGMTSEIISKIFDPFFTTKFMGRGLGLAAVLGIIRAHHGALYVTSKPGEGTTFRVLLPAVAERPKNTGVRRRRSLSGRGTILVVDDEETVQKAARTALEHFGYRVIAASNGFEGVSIFRTLAAQISLVLLDVAMPVMGGEEAFQKIKLIKPDVKVILSSGYDETDVVQRFEGKGIEGFLQKPFTASALGEKIRDVLQGSAQPVKLDLADQRR